MRPVQFPKPHTDEQPGANPDEQTSAPLATSQPSQATYPAYSKPDAQGSTQPPAASDSQPQSQPAKTPPAASTSQLVRSGAFELRN
jgi:hypothetical protein